MELYYLMSITDRDRAEDMAAFAGRKYSGQRNHINKFNKEHPGAEFIPLTVENADLLAACWAGARQHPSSWRCTACPGRKRPSPALWWEPTA